MTAPDARGTRLPALGPNGEGWVVLQVAIMVALGLAGLAGLGVPPRGEPALSIGRIGGAVMIIGGLGFATAGLRGLRENLTANPRPRPAGQLVDTGVYGVVRHPIYTGNICLGLGWGLWTLSLVALVLGVVLGVFFDIKARREEAWLVAAYPGYAAYRARVRKLVPFLY